MKEKGIIFEWKEKGKRCLRTVEREEMYSYFSNLIKEYPYDNEISKALVRIIPDVYMICIDFDQNKNLEVPFITYKMKRAGEKDILKIIRHHKIVWAKLESYTKKFNIYKS